MKLFIKILLLLAVYTPVAETYKSTVYNGFHTYTIPKGVTTITFEGIYLTIFDFKLDII